MEQSIRNISAIVAMTENQVIGDLGKQLYYLNQDLQYFKEKTWGHSIIMGRKTYESIGRTLPGRNNIILTRNKNFEAEGAIITHTIQQVLSLVANETEPFVIGGAQIYKLFMPYIAQIYVTQIKLNRFGDTTFPNYKHLFKQIEESSPFAEDGVDFKFTVWKRIQ